MAINPIALQAKAADTSGALNTLAAVRQIQAANQQRQMNQLAMEDAQRKRSSEEAFKNALMTGDYKTPAGMNRLMGIDPTSALALQKNLLDQETARKSALKSDLELFSKAAGGMPDTAENYSFLYKGAIGDNPALASFLPDPSQYKTGLMQQFAVGAEALYKRATTESANQARLDAANIRAAATRAAAERTAGRPFNIDGSLISPAGEIIYKGNQQTVVSPGSTVLKDGVPIYTAPTAPKQTVVSPGSTLVEEGKAIYTAPPSPQKPTDAIANYEYYEDQEIKRGRQPKSFEEWQKLDSASEIKPPSGYRVTKSGNLEAIPGGPADPEVFANKLTQKQKIEYRQSYDGAKKQLNNFVTSIDQNIALIDSLLQNKDGLDAMFGGVNQYKPSMLMSDQTREALGNYDQLIDKSVLTELTNLRLSSPTGGALGNVTDREGTRLESASAGLQRYLSTESAITRLNRYKKELELAKRNVEGAFNDTYSFLFDDQVNLLNDKGKPSGLLTKKPIEPKPSGVDLDEVDKIVGIGR